MTMTIFDPDPVSIIHNEDTFFNALDVVLEHIPSQPDPVLEHILDIKPALLSYFSWSDQ
jgi:hypothetical protein